MSAMINKTAALLFCVGVIAACTPFLEEEIPQGPLPEPPVFSVQFLAGDSNLVVVEDLTPGVFDRVWGFPGGQPDRSKQKKDTIFFPRSGEYTITLFVSKAGGSGTSQAGKPIRILKDAIPPCDDVVKLLVGGCVPGASRCWTFSRLAGAVTVGPIPGSGEWFKSVKDGLQNEQYDDRFCFSLDDSRFIYENNGLTVDPWKGYAPVPYSPPKNQSWTLVPRGGVGGEPRIILPEGAFMGVWDASIVYDIVVLPEKELVVRTPFLKGGGWFELCFVSAK